LASTCKKFAFTILLPNSGREGVQDAAVEEYNKYRKGAPRKFQDEERQKSGN